MKIGLICGGPSPERGISLNSARSVMDHLEPENFKIAPIYLDYKKRAYKISKAQLYSNTPSDFDFKLQQTAAPLTQKELMSLLKKTNLVFPVMHGIYGEDGGVQRFLEQNNIPFVGSSAAVCRKVFDKFDANELIRKMGFFALLSVVLIRSHKDHKKIISQFFKKYNIKRAVIKPAKGGSSIGVFSVNTPQEAFKKAHLLFLSGLYDRVVLEPFAQGIEFTVIILEDFSGSPVAILPTEIEADYYKHQFFDFRKKYLPTRQVIYHCPPRFPDETIKKIQKQAEQLFSALGMRDFGRFDGWVLSDGNIWFSDFNPISGMEQNSFLFQQASRIGLTHSGVLRHILKRASQRYGIAFPDVNLVSPGRNRRPINVLFGGDTSERQVSVMSGTNVWLKLRSSKKYCPKPFLLDLDANVWSLPYHLTLNHTVEEIAENCRQAKSGKKRLGLLGKEIKYKLGLPAKNNNEDFFGPTKMGLEDFVKKSKFVFIGLHGGDGENGNLQKLLTSHKVKFNGSGEDASRLCLDKWATSNFIKNLNIPGVSAIPGELIKTRNFDNFRNDDYKIFWYQLRHQLNTPTFIVKPRADGCSSGVAHLYSSSDLIKYLKILRGNNPFIPRHVFRNQANQIEMPRKPIEDLIFEKFIETDIIKVEKNKLKHLKKTGWIEITIGVVKLDGKIKALNPSVTLSEGEVLTVEEKFQGGTGINITPPPEVIVEKKNILKTKKLIEKLSAKLKIDGYTRLDAFMNIKTGELMIIEVNTLPGLTPSTVFYQQALAEKPGIFPRELLEILIKNKGY